MLCTAKGHFQFGFINVISSPRVYIWSRVYIFRVYSYALFVDSSVEGIAVVTRLRQCENSNCNTPVGESLPRIVYNQMDFISLELNKTMPI